MVGPLISGFLLDVIGYYYLNTILGTSTIDLNVMILAHHSVAAICVVMTVVTGQMVE